MKSLDCSYGYGTPQTFCFFIIKKNKKIKLVIVHVEIKQ